MTPEESIFARFNHVVGRDGLDAADAWLDRTYAIYRASCFGPRRVRDPERRDLMLRSAVEARRLRALRDMQITRNQRVS